MSRHPTPFSSRRAAAGFSLIEVTLALGIVTFALVGVIGVLPVAMASSRQSIDKNRAAAIAGTLFTSFRSQPFQEVAYLDAQYSNGKPDFSASGLLNLNALPSNQAPPSPFYATFLDVSTLGGDVRGDDFGKQRRLCFTAGGSGGGADYLVTMRFNNHPDGMAITPSATIPAQANQVELVIAPVGRPADQYRFISLIANRTN